MIPTMIRTFRSQNWRDDVTANPYLTSSRRERQAEEHDERADQRAEDERRELERAAAERDDERARSRCRLPRTGPGSSRSAPG